MEVVSKLLGHSKMATTQQSYGKIVQRKVGDEKMKEVMEAERLSFVPFDLYTIGVCQIHRRVLYSLTLSIPNQ